MAKKKFHGSSRAKRKAATRPVRSAVERSTRLRSAPARQASSRKTKSKSHKYVYYFGDGHADGAGNMKALLGGKGANLAEMTRIGLPVPPGFTITTEVCTYYYDNKRTYPKELQAQVEAGVANMEKILGKKFGDL